MMVKGTEGITEGKEIGYDDLHNVEVFGKVIPNCPWCGNTHRLCKWGKEYCICNRRTLFEYLTPPSFWEKMRRKRENAKEK